MRASHDLSGVITTFDESNLVPNAGLLAAAVLAQRIDLGGLIDQRLKLAEHGANSGTKTLTVIGSMLVGGDSIDNVACYGPAQAARFSTPPEPRRRSGRGCARTSGPTSISRDQPRAAGPAADCRRRPVRPERSADDGRGLDHRGGLLAQQAGAAFGYIKVRGYHPQLATCAQSGQVLMSRLRGGSAGAARGAASFLTETISRARGAGATGQLTVRADSTAFYSKAVLSTAAKFDVRFSVTARQDKRIRRDRADHRRRVALDPVTRSPDRSAAPYG